MFLQIALFSSFLWLSNGNPLQYSCLENPMDRGAWWATVHGVAEYLTRLMILGKHTCTHLLKLQLCGEGGHKWIF